MGPESSQQSLLHSRASAADRSVVLYELNEVPWHVVDRYVAARPKSHLAALLSDGLCLTTVNEDPIPLQPWRTWPTFHTSMFTEEHNSYELGQDPSTFRGTTMWDAADEAGLPVGLFGPLQSWPCRPFRRGGFYVPDTFSRSPETVPAGLRRFQQFNITMTRENTFSPDQGPDRREMVATGFDLLRRGITPPSLATLVAHLVQERRDGRYRARRSALQVLPTFDVYWRLHRRTRPRLSIFFTNHVAGMMHRYWGDWDADYAATEDYQPDPVFRGFVETAMDYTDAQLGRIRRHVQANPGTVLVIAGSMGQGPIPYRHLEEVFVLDSPGTLLRALGLGQAEVGLAMYPRISLAFDSDAAAQAAAGPLRSVVGETCGPIFRDITIAGRTASFEINFDDIGAGAGERIFYVGADGSVVASNGATPADLGIVVRTRTGGGNTAYHIPEGILLAWGAGIERDDGRARVDLLDVAPSLLANVLGVTPPASMRGTARLFR